MKKLVKKVTAVLMAFLLAAGTLYVSDRAVSADETEHTETTAIAEFGMESSGSEEKLSSTVANSPAEAPESSGAESTESEASESSGAESAESEAPESSGAESTDAEASVSSASESTEEEVTSNSETGENEEGASTDAYSASLVLAGNEEAFYGGEIITVYNNISVSGNLTVVQEGAYTVISVLKTEFQKPKESEISTSFDKFRSLEIRETEDSYQIITSYKTIYGGYTGGTPVRLNLLPRMTTNLKEYRITQEFYNAEGRRLTESSMLTVTGKSRIERLQSQNFGASRLQKEVDENYVVKDQTYIDFSVSRSYPAYNENDPRARRIWAKIPEGTTVKPGTGWTWDEASGSYYKDMERDVYSSASDALSITLDLGGINLSANDSAKNYRTLQVKFSIQPVENGVPMTDLGPESATCTKRFYILKEEPGTPNASVYIDTIKYNKTIDADYQPVNGGTAPRGSYRHMGGGFFADRNLTVLSYDKSQLGDQRIRYTHKNIYSWNVQNARNDAETRKLVIKSSRVDVSSYTRPSEYRIMLMGLSSEDAAVLRQKMAGTKVYGVTSNGSKTLLTDNAPIIEFARYEESFDASGWEPIGGDNDYQYILFEYPDGGLTLTGQTEIDRFKTAIWTDVVAEIKESTYDLLKERLDSGQSPAVSSSDYAYTAVDSEFIEKEDAAPVRRPYTPYDYTMDYFWMQYEDIQVSNYINVTNGSYFFTDDTVTTHLAYNHGRYGNFSDATEPENLNIYYLVPDGLEPVEDPEMFSSLQVFRGYRDGYNLVSVRPKNISKPVLEEGTSSITRTVQNSFTLSFKATNRLQIGRYEIYACASLDNNKLRVEKGQQYGILQHHTPSGLWSEILKDAQNSPDDQTKFTNFSSAAFTIYPPKVLNSVKQVKLASEPDSKYASSLGKRAMVGDAIDYRWVFKNNSPKAIDELTVIDVLPYRGDTAIIANDAGQHPSRGSCFSTPLISVEQNEKFDFYYSTDPVRETVEENEQAHWQKTVPDMSAVTMIKAVLKEGQQILTDETCAVVTHNRIEDNYKIQDEEKAYNSFAITLNEGNSYVEALKTEVQVTYPRKDVLIEKTDINDPSVKLENAVFSLYEEGTGDNGEDLLVMDDLTTDQQGIAVMQNLPVGKTFYLLEKTAPDGYAREEGKIFFTVEDSADVQTVSVSNDIPRTSFEIVKKWIGKPTTEILNIHILADGEDTGNTVALTSKDGWTVKVSGLPLYNEEGKEILYTIIEEENEAYTAEITGDTKQGFLITNTVKPKDNTPNNPEKTETTVTPQPPNQTQTNTLNVTATGDSSNIMLFAVVLIIAGIAAGAALTYVIIKRKKEKKD